MRPESSRRSRPRFVRRAFWKQCCLSPIIIGCAARNEIPHASLGDDRHLVRRCGIPHMHRRARRRIPALPDHVVRPSRAHAAQQFAPSTIRAKLVEVRLDLSTVAVRVNHCDTESVSLVKKQDSRTGSIEAAEFHGEDRSERLWHSLIITDVPSPGRAAISGVGSFPARRRTPSSSRGTHAYKQRSDRCAVPPPRPSFTNIGLLELVFVGGAGPVVEVNPVRWLRDLPGLVTRFDCSDVHVTSVSEARPNTSALAATSAPTLRTVHEWVATIRGVKHLVGRKWQACAGIRHEA